ncbi:hypothetical protein AKJ65_00245 [candidate division MSBL1 archaeon SCGC-AAA259E19]|uniref:4Fe-4S ferredoxin-type domain-containing protein n=1 Tax=candidate division MSBL1 archaeon SCGC-AAA259E19 TaxID=1698264 RepID=A0A133UNS1_9EURY|nr:hypothetical protein AKJ65_00245 [candidate division MSBL1 archaeon SCGC-AAA259E19]
MKPTDGKDLEGKNKKTKNKECFSCEIAMKKISFNLEDCNTCGECLELCDALSLYNQGFVDHEDCDLCGNCVDICDTGALEMKEEEESL